MRQNVELFDSLRQASNKDPEGNLYQDCLFKFNGKMKRHFWKVD